MLRRAAWIGIAAAFGIWGAWISWYVWPRSSASPGVGSIIIAHDREIVQRSVLALLGLLVVTVTWLLATAPRRRPTRWYAWPTLAAGQLALVAVPATSLFLLMSLLYQQECHPWSDHGQVRTPDGRVLHVQSLHDLDALTQDLGSDGLFLRTRVVGVARAGDTGIELVRPSGVAQYDLANAQTTYERWNGRLVLSRDGEWIVFIYPRMHARDVTRGVTGIRTECGVDLAYAVQTGTYYGGEQLRSLSPFLLVGPQDRLNETDLEMLLENSDRYSLDAKPPFALEALVGDAGNANPEVRSAVAKLLGQYWQRAKEAQVVLKTMEERDPSLAVRKTAREALQRVQLAAQERGHLGAK